MKPKQYLVIAAAAAMLLSLAACGSDQKVTVSGTTSISKGQELTDLQAALNAGAISQAEYDRLRTAILKRPN
jgi:outer membrane murein-binding lipoprotein Lpp